MLSFFRRWWAGPDGPNPLVPAVALLPPDARAAMAAAAQTRNLTRGTWLGCPFQQAGLQVGREAVTVGQAARVFAVDRYIVHHFIEVWDAMRGSDGARTELLRNALAEVASWSHPPAEPGYPEGRAREAAEACGRIAT